MGFILAGYNVIGGFDVCPAAVRFLRRKFGHLIPAENFIVGDVNDPADRAKLPPRAWRPHDRPREPSSGRQDSS